MKLPGSITDILVRQNGTVTSRDIAAVGVSRTMLGRYVAEGLLERASYGVYVSPGTICDEHFALSRRFDRIVFSHVTALFLHGLSERTPFEHSISVRSDETIPASLREKARCFYVRPALFDLGLGTVRTQFGNLVPCYDPERTVCDMIRDRSRVDDETFLAAMRNYVAWKGRNLSRLGEYAHSMGVERRVNAIMEVLV